MTLKIVVCSESACPQSDTAKNMLRNKGLPCEFSQPAKPSGISRVLMGLFVAAPQHGPTR